MGFMHAAHATRLPHPVMPLHLLELMKSLRAKVTLAAAGLLLVFLWAIAWFISNIVTPQMETIQMDRQYEIAQYLAADLDRDITNRIHTLSSLAAAIDTNRLADTAYLQKYLHDHAVLQNAFDEDVQVIDLQGRVQAELPVPSGHRNLHYAHHEAFRQAVATGKPCVGTPTIGLSSKRPVLVITVPVLDARGAVRAVVSGIADLASQSLVGPMLAARALGQSEIFVFSLQDNLIIAAPDRNRILKPAPAPGQSTLYDQFRTGFEGSVIAQNSSNVMKLVSGKRLASTNWIVLVALPTDIAFKPIRVMLDTVKTMALLATVLTLLLVGWATQRLLSPLTRASVRLDAMSSGQVPLQELAEVGEREVRQLLASFNRLSRRLLQQQTELQYSEAMYRSLFDNMLNGFAYCAMIFEDGVAVDFVYLNVNAAFEALTGLRDVVGKKVSDIIPGIHTSDPAILSTYARVVNSGVPERMEHFVDALQQWFLLSIYSTQPGHFVAVFDVITERKRAEQELRLAATAFEAQTGIVVTDANEVILRVNQALTSDTGYSADEAIGQTPRLFKSGRHEPAFYAAMWDSILRTGAWQGEVWGRRKNGEIYPKWQTITAVKDASGVVHHYVSTQTDITERKHVEAELLQMNHALEGKKVQLRELVAQNETTRENERKHIAREVHDELGQLLTAMRMSLSVLSIRFGAHNLELNNKLLGMRALVDAAILAVRNVASNLRPLALDMGLFLALDWLCKDFMQRTGIPCVLDARNPDVALDEARAVVVFRIVQESLTNITRYAKAQRVSVTMARYGNELNVEIQDDGQGFDTQAVKNTKTFGLLGMKERALALGGRLDIVSSPGHGTSVGLTIPYHRAIA